MQRGGGNNNTTTNRTAVHQACASCKHQRKRCADDCILAPYFPAERTQEFQAVQRVFGVSNVVKLVKDVDEERRSEAADSLVWEAVCRHEEPVLGCYGKYKKLKQELELYKIQHPITANQIQVGAGGGTAVYNSYRQPPMVITWNGSGNNNNNNNNNRGINNGSIGGGLSNNNYDNANLSIVESIPQNHATTWHSYLQNQNQNQDNLKQEIREVSSLLLPLQPQQTLHHHNSINGFNQQQQYQYLQYPGQFGPPSTIFMGGRGGEEEEDDDDDKSRSINLLKPAKLS